MSEQSYGIEGLARDDERFSGSRYAEVRDAMYANPYQKVWGASGEKPFERFPVTYRGAFRGILPFGKPWLLLSAAKRALESHADLRWGDDRKGFRRLLHPNGICLFGIWEIAEDTPYTGYFRKGARGLLIARYSTCCTETRRGYTRSLAMIGRIYPTLDPDHAGRSPTASFITQEDIGGADSKSINEAVLRNAPDFSPFKRGLGMPILLATGLALTVAETEPTFRQVYQIAELGKPPSEPTRSPEFMQLTVAPGQPVLLGDDLDFRDEIMAQIYDRGDAIPKRKLVFRIETSDTGVTRGSQAIKEYRRITNWRAIGTMTFTEAVASFNGDRVLHFNHPPWRNDRNDPTTEVKRRR
jgi:hypothetical protein